MSKAKIEMNLSGINALMKSTEIQNALLDAAQDVAYMAEIDGGWYDYDVHTANFVAISNVFPANSEAYYKNLKNNTLLTALSACGLPLKKPKL